MRRRVLASKLRWKNRRKEEKKKRRKQKIKKNKNKNKNTHKYQKLKICSIASKQTSKFSNKQKFEKKKSG